MDSDSSPQRHRATQENTESLCPSGDCTCLYQKNQGGKTHEQERKSYGCSSGGSKERDP